MPIGHWKLTLQLNPITSKDSVRNSILSVYKASQVVLECLSYEITLF